MRQTAAAASAPWSPLSLSPPDNSQPVAHHSPSQPVSQSVSGRWWRGCGLAYTDSSSQVQQQQQQQQRAHLSVSLIYNKFPAKSGHLRCIDIARLCTCSCYGEKKRKRRHLWLTLAPSHRPTDWLTVASAGVVERMHRHTITHTQTDTDCTEWIRQTSRFQFEPPPQALYFIRETLKLGHNVWWQWCKSFSLLPCSSFFSILIKKERKKWCFKVHCTLKRRWWWAALLMHVQFTVFTPNASSSAGISVAVGSGIHCTSFMPVNATAKKGCYKSFNFLHCKSKWWK